MRRQFARILGALSCILLFTAFADKVVFGRYAREDAVRNSVGDRAYITNDWRKLPDGSLCIEVRIDGSQRIVIVPRDRVLEEPKDHGIGILFTSGAGAPYYFIASPQA